MKWILYLLGFTLGFSSPELASNVPSGSSNPHFSQHQPGQSRKKGLGPEEISYIALALSLAGVIMIWMPVVSLVGLIFALLGLGLGISQRKKVKRRWANRLAISLGVLALVSLAIVSGLILFF